jgi:DNA-binding transcriptional MerR regulator
MGMSDLVSLDEVSDRYRCSKRTLRRWLQLGLLPPPIRLGSQRFWRVADLAALESGKA